MSQNNTPRPFAALYSFAFTVHEAAKLYADELGLRQHDAEAIGTDFAHFRTARENYAHLNAEHAARRQELYAARAVAKSCCEQAIDTLKVHLGRRWNPQWTAAGFTNGSIALPNEHFAVLTALAAYFRLHPEREVAVLQVTAEHLEQVAQTLVAAEQAARRAHDEEVSAKQIRDAARTRLRRRIAGVRNELSFLLSPDDGRWYRFGFQRPVDGQIPEPVEDVAVHTIATDEAHVTWAPSARATSYRVSKQVVGRDPEPVEVGLVADPAAFVPDVPGEAETIILITARNRAGETRPTKFIWSPDKDERGAGKAKSPEPPALEIASPAE